MPTENAPTLDLSTGAFYMTPLEDVTLDPVILYRLTYDVRWAIRWAMENRPKLWHLFMFAKTERRRRKNGIRIWRDFFEEVNHGKTNRNS